MKTDPKESRGEHHKEDAGEGKGKGSTGKDMDGQELDKFGKACKGGGYKMSKGQLVKMQKSEIDHDDLEKSIGRLADFAQDDAPTRKETLLAKANTDEMSKAEVAELFEILGGGEAEEDTSVSDAVVKSLGDSEPLQKAIDVSDYLREHHDALELSLRAVGDEIQKSDKRRHSFSIIQAKALVDIGNLVKSMDERLSAIAGQPARAPKSRGVGAAPAKTLEKGFGGTPPEEEQLTKSDVLDTIEAMSKSGMDAVGGERTDLALSKYESTNMISPRVLSAVREFRTKQAAH